MPLFLTVEMVIRSLLAMSALIPLKLPTLSTVQLITKIKRHPHFSWWSHQTARLVDICALMQPRVMLLTVFTAVVGLMIAPAHVGPILGTIAMLAIAGGTGAAGALNMWYDADIDSIMCRTATRPIPRGSVSRQEALPFGLTLAASSIPVLGFALPS